MLTLFVKKPNLHLEDIAIVKECLKLDYECDRDADDIYISQIQLAILRKEIDNTKVVLVYPDGSRDTFDEMARPHHWSPGLLQEGMDLCRQIIMLRRDLNGGSY